MERRSSARRDARSEARTQGAPIADAIGATEDAASGRAARFDGTDCVPPSPPRVVVYSGSGCGLCERAFEVVREVCGEEFVAVEIDGDEVLEARYRESLPVVEIDGERAFTYFVGGEALRRRLGLA